MHRETGAANFHEWGYPLGGGRETLAQRCFRMIAELPKTLRKKFTSPLLV